MLLVVVAGVMALREVCANLALGRVEFRFGLTCDRGGGRSRCCCGRVMVVLVMVVVVVVDAADGRAGAAERCKWRRQIYPFTCRLLLLLLLLTRAHLFVRLASGRAGLLLLLLLAHCRRRRRGLLLLAAADYAGTDASGLVIAVENLAHAPVRHLQLAADLARPSAALRQLDDQLPLVHGQRAPVDEGAAELIAPALAVPDHGARQRLLVLLVLVLEERRMWLLLWLLVLLVLCLMGLLLVLVLVLLLLVLLRGHCGRSQRRLPHLTRERMLAAYLVLVQMVVVVVVRLLRGLVLVVVLRLLANRRRKRTLPGGAVCLALHTAVLQVKDRLCLCVDEAAIYKQLYIQLTD